MSDIFTYKKRYAQDENFRNKWQTARSKNGIRLFIDGEEIPSYSDYSYVDTKNYFKEPERSSLGVINNLNSYATFITPKIRFSFKSMPISAYRVIMRLIKERNEFIVTAYDPVEDEYVVRKMYFAPQDYPQLYTMGYDALRINDIEFELIGTNADLDLYTLTYNSNVSSYGGGSTSDITSGLTFHYGQEITIGDYDNISGSTDPKTFENAGYTFKEWNTERDGSGISYLTGKNGVMFTTNQTLYAIWDTSDKYTVSFDYSPSTDGLNTTVSKEVIYGNAYGTLPTGVREGYLFSGWYTQPSGGGTQVTAETTFDKTYNQTLYAKWQGVTVTVSFDSAGGTGTVSSITSRAGESITLPTNNPASAEGSFKMAGYQCTYWATRTAQTVESGGTTTTQYTYSKYADLGATILCPASNTTLYANWVQGYNISYYLTSTDSVPYTVHKDLAIEDSPPDVSNQRTGYAFAGWYSDASLTTYVNFPIKNIEENMNLYAKWEAVTND